MRREAIVPGMAKFHGHYGPLHTQAYLAFRVHLFLGWLIHVNRLGLENFIWMQDTKFASKKFEHLLVKPLSMCIFALNYKPHKGMGLLDFLFGNKRKKIEAFMAQGGIIIDVRTKNEYKTGGIPGSKNIPLQNITGQLSTIKKWNKPVITCCASGIRSGSAAAILKSNGVQAINGGAWSSLYRFID